MCLSADSHQVRPLWCDPVFLREPLTRIFKKYIFMPFKGVD